MIALLRQVQTTRFAQAAMILGLVAIAPTGFAATVVEAPQGSVVPA